MKGFNQNKDVDFEECFTRSKDVIYSGSVGFGGKFRFRCGIIGCEDCISSWRFRRRNLYGAARWNSKSKAKKT